MKYTNYIIDGNFDIEGIISKKIVLRQITILFAIVVAMSGVTILVGILPFTAMADGERYVRLKYYQYLRSKHKEYQIENLLECFSLNKYQKSQVKLVLLNL